MTELADLYIQLGSAGFIALLFGFLLSLTNKKNEN